MGKSVNSEAKNRDENERGFRNYLKEAFYEIEDTEMSESEESEENEDELEESVLVDSSIESEGVSLDVSSPSGKFNRLLLSNLWLRKQQVNNGH